MLPTRLCLDGHAESENVSDLEELVARAVDGEAAAWNQLVERYTAMVWSIARAHRLNTSDAADVVQVTWLRLVEHLGSIREPAAVGGWIATTAKRECLSVIRKGSKVHLTDQDATWDGPNDQNQEIELDAGLIRSERDNALWRAVGSLDTRCRTLLRVLMADPPPSYTEVSAALDMPVGSIGPVRGRCLDRLRSKIQELGIDVYSGDTL